MKKIFKSSLFLRIGVLEKKHKIVTYASLLFLTISTYFLRSENESIKIQYASIEERNINLKKNMLIFNSNYESFPLPVWQKVKRGNKFVTQYVNPVYVKLFGLNYENDKFELIGKTNFDLFPEKIAQKHYENDVAVSILGERLEAIEEFQDDAGNKMKIRIVKWRDIRDKKDTLVYGIVKEVIPIRK